MNKLIFFGITLFVFGLFLARQHPTRGIFFLNDDTRSDTRTRTEAQTGRNRNNGGSLETGDAQVDGVVVETYVNTTVVDCCTTPKPTTKPNPTDTSKPSPTTPPGQPTSTPTTTPPSNGGGGNGNGNGSPPAGGGDGGIGGTDVQGVAREQGDILGLAATSSLPPVSASIVQGIGLVCAGLGILLRKKTARV